MRVPVRLQWQVVLSGPPVTATIADVSFEGVMALVRAPDVFAASWVAVNLVPGSELVVRGVIGGEQVVMRMRVAWTSSAGRANEFMVGLAMHDVDPENRRAFQVWVVRAMAVLQTAAAFAMDDDWGRAASILEDVGIQDASPALVAQILRHAAGSGAGMSMQDADADADGEAAAI